METLSRLTYPWPDVSICECVSAGLYAWGLFEYDVDKSWKYCEMGRAIEVANVGVVMTQVSFRYRCNSDASTHTDLLRDHCSEKWSRGSISWRHRTYGVRKSRINAKTDNGVLKLGCMVAKLEAICNLAIRSICYEFADPIYQSQCKSALLERYWSLCATILTNWT